MADPKMVKASNFTSLLIMAFFVIFIVVAIYPLGNNRTPDGILGSFDSTGAAILLVGFPYMLLRFT